MTKKKQNKNSKTKDLVVILLDAPLCVRQKENGVLNVWFVKMEDEANKIGLIKSKFETYKIKGSIPRGGPVLLSKGTKLDIILEFDGTMFIKQQETIEWSGYEVNAQFIYSSPDFTEKKQHTGFIRVNVKNEIISEIGFLIEFIPKNIQELTEFNSVFISYSSKDRQQILKPVRSLLALHFDVFFG